MPAKCDVVLQMTPYMYTKSQEATRRLLADTTSFMHHHFYPSMIIDKIMFQCLFLVSGCQNQLRNPITFYRHTGRLLVVQYLSFVRYTSCEEDADVVLHRHCFYDNILVFVARLLTAFH